MKNLKNKKKSILNEWIVGHLGLDFEIVEDHLGLDCEAVEDSKSPKNVKALKQNNPFVENGLWAI